MSTLPPVLVTGASGKTGPATVMALTKQHADGVKTRALVRGSSPGAPPKISRPPHVATLHPRSRAIAQCFEERNDT